MTSNPTDTNNEELPAALEKIIRFNCPASCDGRGTYAEDDGYGNPEAAQCQWCCDFGIPARKALASRDQQIALAAQEVNRFEVINHLPDGKGREVVVWTGDPFKAEFSLQDDGHTLKVFLTDKAAQEKS